MKARYYPYAVAGGLCVMAVPGSELWMLPAALAVAHMAYDAAPDAWQAHTRALLAAAPRLLPDRTSERPLPAPAPALPTVAPLRPREWVAALNDQPDRAPHALITGPTGAGKTTAARALLGQRGGQALVVSPKITPDAWNGATVITLDDTGGYGPIAQTLAALEVEKRRRIKLLRQQGAAPIAPLTVVLDEVPELVRFVPEAGAFVTSMASIGRELQIRLVLLSTSTRVAALGIKGRGDTLDNFVRLDIDRDRHATLNDGIAVRPVELGNIRAGAERAQLAPWQAPAPTDAPAPVDLAFLLDGLLAERVPSAAERQKNASAVPVPVPDHAGNRNRNSDARGARSDVIVTPSERGGVHVMVNAQATAAPGTGRARRRGHGLDMRARRQRVGAARRTDLHRAYYDAGAAGESWRSVYGRLHGSKDEMFPAWQEGRKAKQAIGGVR